MFSITEIIVTAIVINLCNRDNPFSSWKFAAIFAISVFHVICSGLDQFILHVVRGTGKNFQVARDLGLMVPDLLHVFIPIREFYLYTQQQKQHIYNICYKEEIILMVIFVTLGTFLLKII